MTKGPKVSVIIPSYNEGTYIGRLLKALSKQNFEDFEVIVSDANSKDKTAEVVDSYKDKLSLKLISSPPKGPGHGRNVGAKAARGEWLLFLDADDDIDDQGFIKTLLDETEKHGWKTSSAKMKSRQHDRGLRVLYAYQKALAHSRRPVASGYCIFTKREVFEKAGGFSEKIQFGEDYEYVSRSSRGSFGFVDKTYYFVDPRRNESEGLNLVLKGTLNEIYRLLLGYKKLEKNPIKYEFGKHKELK